MCSPGTETQSGGPWVCAVVLNWEGAGDTLDCLAALAAQTRQPDTVLVCDNGSRDDSLARIEAWAGTSGLDLVLADPAMPPGGPRPPLALLPLTENRGYAAGNNAALALARRAWGFDHFWVLNNDTEPEPGALAALLACASATPGAGIIGSTVVHAHDPARVQCAGGWRYHPATTAVSPVFGGLALREAVDRDEPRLDYVYGASMFLAEWCLERIGLFSEDYFLFYEELDLCRRAQAQGVGLAWCRESVVRHKTSRSLPRLDRADEVVAYHENLSTLLFTRKFHPGLLPLALAVRLLAKTAKALASGRPSRIGPVLRACRDFFFSKYKLNML